MRCSRLVKDGQLVTHLFDDARTLYETFQRGKQLSGQQVALSLLLLGATAPPLLQEMGLVWDGGLRRMLTTCGAAMER